MEEKAYPLEPKTVKKVSTPFRKITTQIPVPESLRVLEDLARYEPRAMGGQPPIVWDRAEGFQVYDRYGNQWLDWSSGVLVTNVGHSHPKIVDAVIEQAKNVCSITTAFPPRGAPVW